MPKTLSGKDIRQSFIDFFRSKNHDFIPSSPLAPEDDPTLMFINAGMNQFKSYFLGQEISKSPRVANSQKCLRVSGKHNDLEEVGRDGTHHTFFEMLGSWSFGDYYKKEAIQWAWELLTEEWQLPKERLFVSVHHSDQEARDLWRQTAGIPNERILSFGDSENFWEMGDTGPCGPSSEIHYDTGDLATQDATFADPVKGVNGENERYIEIWNLVFIQNNRLSDGRLEPLGSTHIDTGMGLERVTAILNGLSSNYESDLFKPIIDKVASLSHTPYHADERGTGHRVIADHMRALCFAIADGVQPSNEGRGYVIRRILRRASRFAYKLGQNNPLLCHLVPEVVEIMGQSYPEISAQAERIAAVIKDEETRFLRTLGQGLSRIEKSIKELKSKGEKTIAGRDVFLLHDTYGFPSDLTRAIARDEGFAIDEAGFAQAMDEQKERARKNTKFQADLTQDEHWTLVSPETETTFVGYETLDCPSRLLRYAELNDELYLVLDQSPFYAEAGGQCGDQGVITTKDKSLQIEVLDTVKLYAYHLHRCRRPNGSLEALEKQVLYAQVDVKKRQLTAANHTATHLLHAALQQVLGEKVVQQGSWVGPSHLRFDFAYPKSISLAELHQVETIVNSIIAENEPVTTELCSLEEAKSKGAMALFGEKYGKNVRVLKIGEFSLELCGGTHAKQTGDIGLFKIMTESSIAAGIRRVEAKTQIKALEELQGAERILRKLGEEFKSSPEDFVLRLGDLKKKVKDLEAQIKVYVSQGVDMLATKLVNENSEMIGKRQLMLCRLDPVAIKPSDLQTLLDKLASKLRNGIAIVTHAKDDQLAILCAVSSDLTKQIQAGKLIKEIAPYFEARGGGRADKARAGSKAVHLEESGLSQARSIVLKHLAD